MARFCELTTPLGDALEFSRMRVSEGMSRLFEIQLHVVSLRADIDPNDLLGQNVTIKVTFSDGVERFFNGYVRRFAFGGSEGRYFAYRMEVVPWLWFLTRTADCRIFQDQNVPDILDAVLADEDTMSVTDRMSDRSKYAKGEYWVQYRETDFNFVSRLMEQEGIYYFFEHGDGQHDMVLIDSRATHKPIEGEASIRYLPPNPDQVQPKDVVASFSLHQEVQPGQYALQEYDFKKPGNDMLLQRRPEIDIEHTKPSYEVFDYPGDYDAHSDGENYVAARIEELSTQSLVFSGSGLLQAFHVGRRFKLTDHPRDDHNTDYLILSTDYEIFDPPHESGGEASGFNCSFTAIRATQQFRPPRVTPRPLIHGIQSAVVTGPSGEEIYTDEYGRIKVQFHWDRYGQKDAKTSCWLRVAFLAAGARWGFVSIPRIGHEVIVSFLEGDPDRPLVTGVVYNGANMPPWDLPANKTQWGMLSRSTLKGAAANANALRFEDKKGQEQVWLHAEKNQDIEVENDETHWVGHDRSKTIDHDETVHVKHDRTETVDNNETITIGNNRTESVGVNEQISIGANRTETVGANEQVTIGANRTHAVGANESLTVSLQRTHTVGVNETIVVGAAQEIVIGAAQAVAVGANQSVNVGASRTVSVGADHAVQTGGSHSEQIGKERSTSVGKDDSLDVGKNLVINAGDSITIKTGSASITMKKDGTITIKGKDITIDGSGKINVKAGKDIVMKGSKILQN